MKTAEWDLRNVKRLAVIGGTFDPIHYGHLALAEAALYALRPQRVLFIPAGNQPHKRGARVSARRHRYAMTLLATAKHPFFDISEIEVLRDGFSYTVDTVRALRGLLPPEAELFFIAGTDAVGEIGTWKDPGELLSMCRLAFAQRPGTESEATRRAVRELQGFGAAEPVMLDMPAMEISSTEIRRRIACGKSARYLLPGGVLEYIKKERLYLEEGGDSSGFESKAPSDDEIECESLEATDEWDVREFLRETSAFDFGAAERELEQRLSAKRFKHTRGVVAEAERLASIYGEDIESAKIAALLHDCAKEYGDAKKRCLCRLWDVATDEAIETHIDLAHSLLGAESARRDFGVRDEKILRAIRYHTTGNYGMTLFDKVVMLADYTEPYRGEYGALSEMRALAGRDIDEALRVGIRFVMKLNAQRGRIVHPWSRAALDWLDNNKE